VTLIQNNKEHENKQLNTQKDLGAQMYQWVSDLFPICRSITGNGLRETLQYIKILLPDLILHEVPSGTEVFDWTVPKEWNIRDAYIEDEQGHKVVDFHDNNLHVWGYSVPVDQYVSLKELEEHLYSLEDQPDAIPYVTSYYVERWGFSITHRQRARLKPGRYHVVIASELKDGHLTYGELVLPGKSEKEIFLSTYVCHPSMANNELSGPAVTTQLVKWIQSEPRLYTYRIIFIPERIGSIVYLSRNLDIMKRNTLAGFNVTCVGDDRTYSLLPTRYGNTLADKVALHVLRNLHPDFIHYSFLDRGSDERQYCAPGVDLPVVSVMRSKYGEYPEYHTSLDNLDFVTPDGLRGSFEVLKYCIFLLENNFKYRTTCLLEPQLGKRGLYPTLSTKKAWGQFILDMTNFIAYADGSNDIVDIANILGCPAERLYPIIEKLKEAKLIEV